MGIIIGWLEGAHFLMQKWAINVLIFFPDTYDLCCLLLLLFAFIILVNKFFKL